MRDLILILIIVICQGYIDSPSFYISSFLILLLYSRSVKNYRTTFLFVMLMIAKSLSYSPYLLSLLEGLHTNIYDSFGLFIATYWPGDLMTFLISITVGTADAKLPKDIYYSFKKFNMLHVVSISGANFSLIKNLFEPFSKYINRKKLNIFILIIQTYYIILVGFTNFPALRAYLFTAITLYSSISGRPINFVNKLILAIIFIINLNYESLSSIGFFLSIGFSVLYKSLELNPLSRIFNNELKKISLVFILSMFIFNSENPDFIANLVFSMIYPSIFVLTFIGYSIHLLGMQIFVIAEFVLLLIRLILGSLNQLSSTVNTYIQTSLFIAILAKTFKSTLNNRKHEYSKFSQ